MDSRHKGLNKDQITKVESSARRHGVSGIRVFGSVVHGTASAESDLDLLVTLEEGRDMFDLIAFKQDLEKELGCPVDVLTEAALSPYIHDAIITEAVPISETVTPV